MSRIPLIGGSYVARSKIANAQRCINYYPELNAKDAPVPMTYYQRPGFRPLGQGPALPVRGLYRASNGKGYAAIGQTIYAVTPDFILTPLGDMSAPLLGPVRMQDNGIEILIVDGSPNGYQVLLSDNTFSVINDLTGAFTGANVVDFLDTFLLWNVPGTQLFGSTLSNELTFDALYLAGKAGYPDPLISLIVNRRQVILLGTLKSEIWYNAGNFTFPFAELPGTYIEHGCVAAYSVASQDIEVYWLSQDLQGRGVVMMQRGYETKRISNHALEYAIQQMIVLNQPISNAIAYTYQQGGHVFYVLIFPSANQTWAYDASIQDPTMAWSQRCWTDANGGLNRDRSNCHAYLYDLNVVGDWQNGTLYALDQSAFVDVVQGVTYPITFIRGFPHVTSGMVAGPMGEQLAEASGKQIQYSHFALDMDCGDVALDSQGQPALVGLRWSRDRGKTFGETVLQSAGAPGLYLTQPTWGQVGVARDMVFEIIHNIAGPAALQGAWVKTTVMGN